MFCSRLRQRRSIQRKSIALLSLVKGPAEHLDTKKKLGNRFESRLCLITLNKLSNDRCNKDDELYNYCLISYNSLLENPIYFHIRNGYITLS